MLEYDIVASRIDAHGAVARAKNAEVSLDTDPAGQLDAFNPAELLLAAVAACIIKGVERSAPLLHFKLRSLDVHVHGVRGDDPPKMATIAYEILVDTDETDHRLELLHTNIRKYGTIYNTLASAVSLSGTIERSVPGAPQAATP